MKVDIYFISCLELFLLAGFVASHQMLKLSATMPPMSTMTFMWVCLPKEMEKSIFLYSYSSFKSAKTADYNLCNTFHEIEPEALKLVPDLLPIGPLLPARRSGQPVGHFWPEDSSCLDWLDEQDNCSVVYVALGSITLLKQRQFHELALGLELTGKSFLWVVRPDLMDGSSGVYPEGFEARLAGRGRMVSWAPQQKVLAHPSIACFMSHCGWNSTMEGVANGVPFLCWPYFADQLFNASYICNVWKTGLRLELGEDGILTREEVKNKAGELLNDEGIKARVTKLKETARWNVDEGQSKTNFDQFIKSIST